MSIEHLKYPVGRFKYQAGDFASKKDQWLQTIENFPSKLAELAEKLSEEQLDTQYRPEGWTARQVIHHVVDSHLNSYVRFKWTLTEDEPLIKPYKEALWAELPDTFETPIEVSLQLLKSLHQRWIILLKSMTNEQWEQKLGHPDWEQPLKLKLMLGLYAWHCNHHYEHVNIVASR